MASMSSKDDDTKAKDDDTKSLNGHHSTSTNPPYTLRDGLQRAFLSSNYSDLIVHCDGKEFKVHKLVLCSQSEFFRMACKPDTFKEGKENRIDLPDDDLVMVESMLEFLYTAHFTIPQDDNIAIFLVRLCSIADKYIIPQLRLRIQSRFTEYAQSHPFESGLADAIPTIFASENDVFKSTMVQVALDNSLHLFGPSGCEPFKVAMRGCAEYASSVAFALTAKLGRTEARCKNMMEGYHLVPKEEGMSKMDFYRCQGSKCRRDGGIFAVSKKVSRDTQVVCPLNCYRPTSLTDRSSDKLQLGG